MACRATRAWQGYPVSLPLRWSRGLPRDRCCLKGWEVGRSCVEDPTISPIPHHPWDKHEERHYHPIGDPPSRSCNPLIPWGAKSGYQDDGGRISPWSSSKVWACRDIWRVGEVHFLAHACKGGRGHSLANPFSLVCPQPLLRGWWVQLQSLIKRSIFILGYINAGQPQNALLPCEVVNIVDQ